MDLFKLTVLEHHKAWLQKEFDYPIVKKSLKLAEKV